jgi:copper/silver efflux system protein
MSPEMSAAPGSAGSARGDGWDQWQQQASVVPLGALVDVRVVTAPPMIKDENGVLVGYVYADIDATQRDLGGWVADAKSLVGQRLSLPAGYRWAWTGQHEFMADTQARMRPVLPLTFVLIVALLYLSLRGWAPTWLVLLSLPFAIAGRIWLLAILDEPLDSSLGRVAVGGVAAQAGIVIVVYLDQAVDEWRASGRLREPKDVDAAAVVGAAKCLRPMVMTVATTVLGLMPLLFESGVGADLSARTAAPVMGGSWSGLFLTLLVLPAAYATWRRRELAASRGGGQQNPVHTAG